MPITREQLIKELRKRAGSRMKLANLLEVSLSAAQAWEKEGTTPDGGTLARMVLLFPDRSVDIFEAFGGISLEEAVSIAQQIEAGRPPAAPAHSPHEDRS